MKKILLSLFGIITLGLINFSSAGSYTYTGTQSLSITSIVANSTPIWLNLNIPLIDNNTSNLKVSCSFSNLSSNLILSKLSINAYYYSLINGNYNAGNYAGNNLNYNSFEYTFTNLQLYTYLTIRAQFSTYGDLVASFDYSCTLEGDNIINQSDLGNSGDSSCSPSGQCTVSDKVEGNLLFTGSKSFSNAGYTNMFNYGTEGAGTYCMKFTSTNAQTLTMGFANGGTTSPTNLYSLYNDQYGNWICLYGNKPYLNIKLNAGSNTIDYEVYKLTDLLSDDIPCVESSTPECDDWTQLQCESEYDLIPESSITSEYCEEIFNLIDPENCPASGGTGDVQWSSFFVNSHQVQGASNIYLWLPDFLNWDYTYVDSGSTLEIDVENEGDQEYINNILDIQSYHPDKDQFAQSFAGFLTLLMPYIIITLFIVFVWRLIRRIFR